MKARFPCQWPLGLDVLYAQYNAIQENHLLAFQQRFLDELGPNLEIKILGSVGYTTFDPVNVEAVLSSRFEGACFVVMTKGDKGLNSPIADYCLGSRRGALFPFIGEGIFTQDGGPWKHSRELLRRPFMKTHYQDLKGFAEPLDNIVTSLSSLSPDTVTDLQPLFFHFTLATTTALIFGQPLESSDNLEKYDFAASFNYTSLISSLRMRLIDFYWIYNPSQYRIACRNVKACADSFVERAVQNRKKSMTEKTSGLYTFVEDLCNEIEDPKLIRDQLVNVLLAGRDTTACLLSWTL